jgi:hypothetical protein
MIYTLLLGSGTIDAPGVVTFGFQPDEVVAAAKEQLGRR